MMEEIIGGERDNSLSKKILLLSLILAIFLSASWTNSILEKTMTPEMVKENPLFTVVSTPREGEIRLQGTGSGTVCIENIGACNTLGTGWNQEGATQETVDALWCGTNETSAGEWWDKWEGAPYFLSNANVPSANWGIERSFSKDVDASRISIIGAPKSTSNLIRISAGGINPVVFTNLLGVQKGLCSLGVMSNRNTCCKDFGTLPDHVCVEVLGSAATNPNICTAKLGTNHNWQLTRSWLSVDAMYCNMKENEIFAYWDGLYPIGQELLGADWGMGIGDTDPSADPNINTTGLTKESTLLAVPVAVNQLGMNPKLFTLGSIDYGSCPLTVVSQRSLCCT